MLCTVLIIAFLMGVAGMVIESAQTSIVHRRLIYKGDQFFYNLPSVFIYAVGGSLFYFTTKALIWMPWYKVVISLALIASVWEYVAGYFCDHVTKKKFWDYSERKFNLYGYVSLWSMMWWLVFACIFYFFVFDKLIYFDVYLRKNLLLSPRMDYTIFMTTLSMIGIIALRRIKEYATTKK